jgi:hypothetical protein
MHSELQLLPHLLLSVGWVNSRSSFTTGVQALPGNEDGDNADRAALGLENGDKCS